MLQFGRKKDNAQCLEGGYLKLCDRDDKPGGHVQLLICLGAF